MINDAALDTGPQTPAGPGFTAGLIAGGIIGAVLALAFAPRAGVDLRRRVTGAAKDLGAAAAARGHDMTARAGAAVERLTQAVPPSRPAVDDPGLVASAVSR
jgi:gas vesicle protein